MQHQILNLKNILKIHILKN